MDDTKPTAQIPTDSSPAGETPHLVTEPDQTPQTPTTPSPEGLWSTSPQPTTSPISPLTEPSFTISSAAPPPPPPTTPPISVVPPSNKKSGKKLIGGLLALVLLSAGLLGGLLLVKQNQDIRQRADYCAICSPANSCECINGQQSGYKCKTAPASCSQLGNTWQPDGSCSTGANCGGGGGGGGQCPANNPNNCAIYECPTGCTVQPGQTKAECRTLVRYADCASLTSQSVSDCGQIDFLNGDGTQGGSYCGVMPNSQCRNGITPCSAPPPPTPSPSPIDIPNCTSLTTTANLNNLIVGQTYNFSLTATGASTIDHVEITAYRSTCTNEIKPYTPLAVSGPGTYQLSWTPTTAGAFTLYGRVWNDGIAECRSDCVDGPPRYLCAGAASCKFTGTVNPAPSPTPSPTPIPSASPVAMCTDLKFYTVTGTVTTAANWTSLTASDLAQLKQGNVIYVSVVGTATGGGTIDRARIRVNKSTWGPSDETTNIKPKLLVTDPNEYYISYAIPADGTTTFTFGAEVHQVNGTGTGWR